MDEDIRRVEVSRYHSKDIDRCTMDAENLIEITGKKNIDSIWFLT